MHAIVADASGDESGSFVDGPVEMTSGRMTVAFASFALVDIPIDGRSPWKIVEEILAFLTIQTSRVMSAFALTVNLNRNPNYGTYHSTKLRNQ